MSFVKTSCQRWMRCAGQVRGSERAMKPGTLGEKDWRRALEKVCEKWRRKLVLQTEVSSEGLKHEWRNEADKEDRQQIESDAGGARLRSGACPVRSSRRVRIYLVGRGEEFDDRSGVGPCAFNARLDACKRSETDGSHCYPDPRVLWPIPRHSNPIPIVPQIRQIG